MKYLQDYMADQQTTTFEKYGAFFAFSGKQFAEQKKEGVKYCSLGSGLIVPTEHTEDIKKALDDIYTNAIKQDLEENGVKAIIHRELANHECQIVGDYNEVVELLEPYKITADQVKKEWPSFYDKCVENDWF